MLKNRCEPRYLRSKSAILTRFENINFPKNIISGLRPRYNADAEFKNQCKMVTALAFVPLDQVVACFEQLSVSIPDEFADDMEGVLDWFEDSYIGRARNNRRRNPMFPPRLWSVHERVIHNLDR